MDMQDKDLDKLFQSALDDYEIEPSAKVWEGISETMDAGKRKRMWIPFLSVAAGIVLLVTAGLLFLPREEVVVKPKNNALAKATVPVKTPSVVKPTPVTPNIIQQNKNSKGTVIAQVNTLATTRVNKVHQAAPQVQVDKSIVAKPNEQPVLASANVSKEIIKAVVPDTATKIMAKQIVDETPVFASIKPAVVPAQTATAKPTMPVKKHKIRSLGDVFNVMIAAVDKRKDKIIEFSNTDEDDATITGVNLGIVKIKKEK
jgi:Rieske Fe-S protein